MRGGEEGRSGGGEEGDVGVEGGSGEERAKW